MEIVKATPMQFAHVVSVVHPQQARLTLIVKATFVLADGQPLALAVPDQQLPCSGEVRHDDVEMRSLRYDTDFVVQKLRGECILAGSCHAPQGKPTTVSGVAFRVGKISKALAVFGDRHWVSKLFWSKASAPTEFTSMPLRWERSFGGIGTTPNPYGVGAVESETPQGRRRLLPNLEDPKALISASDQKPNPVGTTPVPESARKGGGSGDNSAWRTAQVPRFPTGFDFSSLNTAPVDQQIDGFWRGDEEIVLRNLHPKHEKLKTRLPGLRARCFLHKPDTDALQEVPLVLDTITIDTDIERVFAVWRAVVPIASEQPTDLPRAVVFHDTAEERLGLDHARSLLGDAAPQKVEQIVAANTGSFAAFRPPNTSRSWAPRATPRPNPSLDVLASVSRAREDAMQRLKLASRQSHQNVVSLRNQTADHTPSASPPSTSTESVMTAPLETTQESLPPLAPAQLAPAPWTPDAPSDAPPPWVPPAAFGASTEPPNNFAMSFAEQLRNTPEAPPITAGTTTSDQPNANDILASLPDYLLQALKSTKVDAHFSPTYVPGAAGGAAPSPASQDLAQAFTFVLPDSPRSMFSHAHESTLVNLSLDDIEEATAMANKGRGQE